MFRDDSQCVVDDGDPYILIVDGGHLVPFGYFLVTWSLLAGSQAIGYLGGDSL